MFLKNAVHIHNKAIFDALNEILDKHRPYGVWGEPFSWKTTAKFYHLKNNTLKNVYFFITLERYSPINPKNNRQQLLHVRFHARQRRLQPKKQSQHNPSLHRPHQIR